MPLTQRQCQPVIQSVTGWHAWVDCASRQIFVANDTNKRSTSKNGEVVVIWKVFKTPHSEKSVKPNQMKPNYFGIKYDVTTTPER